MRDLPGLTALLDRASIQAARPPQYRFHGRRPPQGERPPIFNESPEAAVADGVATMRLYAPIDSWGGFWGVSASEFVEALDTLDDDVTEIRLHINSPGGEIFESLAILNQLRQHKARVVAVVDGIAASCASFLAVAADETVMAPNSQLMIHDAWGYCVGDASEMHATGDLLEKLSANLASIYAAKAGDETDWRAVMRGEAWYDAAEAVEAGLADSVLGEDAGVEDEPPAASSVTVTLNAEHTDDLTLGRRDAAALEAEEPAAEGTPNLDAIRAEHLRIEHAELARTLALT